MNITDIYKIFTKYPHITTDSRQVKKGSIFFALKGENSDGNKYVYNALENGAEYAVADDKNIKQSERVIIVDNVLETLQELAEMHRTKLALPMLAITGSNGKTTTKELTNSVISKKYNVAVTKGNFNNHIGVPLTLLEMKADNNFSIVEMGTNHFGEIETLCKIAKPNFGLINNIGKAHLEFFGDLNGVVKAKTEMFKFLSQTDGKVFVNEDIEIINSEAKKYIKSENIIYFGKEKLNIQLLENNDNLFLEFLFDGVKVQTNLVGNYNMDNAMAAIAAGKYFGVSNADIIDAIRLYIPQNNRSQFIVTQNNKLYMDAYNANPTSMRASLLNFIEQKTENKMLVLGDMRELGDKSDNEHNEIIKLVEKSGIKDVVLIGSCFKKASSNSNFKSFNNVDDFIDFLKSNRISQKTILIKGSNGVHLEKLATHL